jgi:hypothetical protein
MLSRCRRSRCILERGAAPFLGKKSSRTGTTISRRFLSSSQQPASEKPKRAGGILIGAGWALLGLLAVDQYLQYGQKQERAAMLEQMQDEANEVNKTEWGMDLKTLFSAKVAHTEASLDGTKIIQGISVGDVVEVIEAEVGPHGAYHLCRLRNKDGDVGAMGWYPKQFLENITKVETKVSRLFKWSS